MAETVLDLVAKQFRDEGYKHFGSCYTEKMPISGGRVGGSTKFSSYISKTKEKAIGTGLSDAEAREIISTYGSNAPLLFEIARKNKEKASEIELPLPVLAKLGYAIEYELAYTPLDFFNRRTGMVLFDIKHVHEYKNQVISYMKQVLHWTEQQTEIYTKELETALHDAAYPQSELVTN